MNRYRLPLFALIVGVLVAVVALVARGRPLAGAPGKGGLSGTFWDFAITTVVIVGVLIALGLLYLGFEARQKPFLRIWAPPGHGRSLLTIVLLSLTVSVLFGLFRLFFHRSHHKALQPGGGGGGGRQPPGPLDTVHFRWGEALVVGGLLLVAGLIAYVLIRRRKSQMRPAWTAPEVVAAALDVSLDDLRSDPDVRRAIIAAYARMETAFAVSSMPRRPAEAPREYLERALLALDTSQASVSRLTELFEWAKFSHHEPEPSMRDEAVDALEAVRDELRAPAAVAA